MPHGEKVASPRARRFLTVVGDATSVATWSGIPYFFLQAAQKHGVLDDGLKLDPAPLKSLRPLWNAAALLRSGRPGGFQYSEGFLRKLFAQAKLSPDEPLDFVSHFPLLPPRPWGQRWRFVPYIDATLKQNFDDYGFGARVGSRFMQDVLEREREAYHAAACVVCMSRWAADVVKGFYGVPAERVEVVLPGANLVEEELPALEATAVTLEGPLRLGFVGKDWERKGLLRLLSIAEVLARREVACEVVTIGPPLDALPKHPLLRPAGFINKHRDLKKFVELVRSCHFGFLLSKVEALGISTLEFLRLGVPAVGTRVGGIVDALPEEMGVLVDATESAETTADTLYGYAKDVGRYAALRARVTSRAAEFSWARTAAAFGRIFDERMGR